MNVKRLLVIYFITMAIVATVVFIIVLTSTDNKKIYGNKKHLGKNSQNIMLKTYEYKTLKQLLQYDRSSKDIILLKNNCFEYTLNKKDIDISFGYGHNNTCCFPSRLDYFDENIKEKVLIGYGSFGYVCKIKTTCCDSIYAMKETKLNKTEFFANEGFYNEELYFSKFFQLNDLPHTVKSYHAYAYKTRIVVIYELLEKGDLQNISFAGNLYNEKKIRKYINSLCLAIAIYHKHKIIHKDIKPENICIDSNNNLKIIDFGISTKDDSGYQKMYSLGGTIRYIPPEYLYFQTRMYYQTDWWAVGVLIYFLVENKFPYTITSEDKPAEQIRKLKKTIENREFREFTNKNINEDLKDLIINLLEPDQDKRLGGNKQTYNDVLSHKYFRNENLKSILNKYNYETI
ncbi:Protein kinase [Spraguea lophii 42_110]|uniref:non-specific serine/threonine protein kinase n=1 Tax=Spraguea lophii (strain 42_110) TaxID=1358809 RepID=S7WCC9_SPRLO|nr:Protein kinase [Spraguea lophii 42_110]